MQVAGDEGNPVRIIASTSFVDADGGIEVDGRRLEAPYRISVIGDPTTMHTALRIAGGVMDSVENKRGRVQIVEMDEEPVTVTAVRAPRTPRYARPAS
jgi:uncharacterized protein YlxW (UPF0749 family)